MSMRISKSNSSQAAMPQAALLSGPRAGTRCGAGCCRRAIIEQGREVGILARQLFPGGVEVRSEGGLDKAIRATRELVANREVPAIFEGAFEHGGVLVRVDVSIVAKTSAGD